MADQKVVVKAVDWDGHCVVFWDHLLINDEILAQFPHDKGHNAMQPYGFLDAYWQIIEFGQIIPGMVNKNVYR